MAIGSATSFYQSGSIYQRHGLSGSHTSGEMYRKFNPSNADKMNRRAIESSISAFSSGISSIYNANYSFWEGLSQLAVEEVQRGIQAELEAKLEEATRGSGSLLNLKI